MSNIDFDFQHSDPPSFFHRKIIPNWLFILCIGILLLIVAILFFTNIYQLRKSFELKAKIISFEVKSNFMPNFMITSPQSTETIKKDIIHVAGKHVIDIEYIIKGNVHVWIISEDGGGNFYLHTPVVFKSKFWSAKNNFRVTKGFRAIYAVKVDEKDSDAFKSMHEKSIKIKSLPRSSEVLDTVTIRVD